MRLGVDLDGTVAKFNEGFLALLTDHWRWKPCPKRFAQGEPAVWDWPEALGFTDEEVAWGWDRIRTNPMWWATLDPYPGTEEVLSQMCFDHEVFFISARFQDRKVREVSEVWLRGLGVPDPVVLLTDQKGSLCAALGIDQILDDCLENLWDVRLATHTTEPVLMDRPWNQGVNGYRRIFSLEEFCAPQPQVQ